MPAHKTVKTKCSERRWTRCANDAGKHAETRAEAREKSVEMACVNARTQRQNSENRKKIGKAPSSNVQLEGLELGSNGVASWACGCTTATVFADQHVDALLAQATNAFRACIAVAQYG